MNVYWSIQATDILKTLLQLNIISDMLSFTSPALSKSCSLQKYKYIFTWQCSAYSLRLDGRFAAWMYSHKICSNCGGLSCKHDAESLLSHTSLNSCREDLNLFREPFQNYRGMLNKVAAECIFLLHKINISNTDKAKVFC